MLYTYDPEDGKPFVFLGKGAYTTWGDTGAVEVFYPQTAFVDATVGSDESGLIGYVSSPFMSSSGALQALHEAHPEEPVTVALLTDDGFLVQLPDLGRNTDITFTTSPTLFTPYNVGASYAVGDIVIYDGIVWYRTDSHGGNTGDTPYNGSAFWSSAFTPFTYGTTYTEGAIIVSDGYLWYRTVASVGPVPSPPTVDPSYWTNIGSVPFKAFSILTGPGCEITLRAVTAISLGQNRLVTDTATDLGTITGENGAYINVITLAGEIGQDGSSGYAADASGANGAPGANGDNSNGYTGQPGSDGSPGGTAFAGAGLPGSDGVDAWTVTLVSDSTFNILSLMGNGGGGGDGGIGGSASANGGSGGNGGNGADNGDGYTPSPGGAGGNGGNGGHAVGGAGGNGGNGGDGAVVTLSGTGIITVVTDEGMAEPSVFNQGEGALGGSASAVGGSKGLGGQNFPFVATYAPDGTDGMIGTGTPGSEGSDGSPGLTGYYVNPV